MLIQKRTYEEVVQSEWESGILVQGLIKITETNMNTPQGELKTARLLFDLSIVNWQKEQL